MKLALNYNKNPHQKEFHEDTTTRRLHLSTGFGGGKTFAAVMKMIKLSAINSIRGAWAHGRRRLKRDIGGGIIAESFAEFKKDWLPLIEEICEDNKIDFEYKANGRYGPFFRFPWSKAPVFVQSAEKKIRGPNWGWAVVNELTLIKLIRYKEILGRVRIKGGFPQIASVGTPEGTANEYYEYLIENPPENTRVIYGSSQANIENLDPEYIKDLFATYDTQMQQTYISGLWVNMTTNQFYYGYSPETNDQKTYKRAQFAMNHVGLDFNVDHMSASVWQFVSGKLMGIDEIVLPDNASTKLMCDALKARGYHPDNTTLYPDPAGHARSTKGKPDITILKGEGFYNICAKRKAETHRKRQLHMNNLFEKGIIMPNPERQPKMIKDLVGVEMNPVKLEKDKSNPKLTHLSDGLDYLCDILIEFKKPKRRTTQGRRI